MIDDKFELTRVGRGAILLDTASGAILELNEAATFVWERRLEGEPSNTIVATFAARYGLPLQAAASDVEKTLNPPLEGEPQEPGDFRYEETDGGYTFTFRGQGFFLLDPTGASLRMLRDADDMLAPLLRALTPKLLALQGQLVLHASAVELKGVAIAFTGASGAGKTTTARALAKAGGRLLSEDQLCISTRDGDVVRVSEAGERTIVAWVADTAERLKVAGKIDCRDLGRMVAAGSSFPLAEIGFVDAARRTAGGYAANELRTWETAGLTFRNSFHGSAQRGTWVRRMESCAKVGCSTKGFQLALPDGLDRLAVAAQHIGSAASLKS